MIVRESAVWKTLSRILDKHMPDDKWATVRIETGATILGFPDVLFLRNGKATFIELKKAQGNQVNLSPQQVNMHEMLTKLGFDVFTVVYKEATTTKPAAFHVGRGKYSRAIQHQGLKCDALTAYPVNELISMKRMLLGMGLYSLDK